jgi:3D (Asp-Asp-Asp) domain-containing protein
MGDTGGAIRGRKLDIFMGTGQPALKKALQWGRRRLAIFIFTAQVTN